MPIKYSAKQQIKLFLEKYKAEKAEKSSFNFSY